MSPPKISLPVRLSAVVALALVGSMLLVNWLVGFGTQNAPALMVIYMVLAGAGGFFVAFLLDLMIVRPLRTTVTQVRAAAKQGWDRPIVPPREGGEFEELATALEELRASVISQQKTLAALNLELEERVEERTAQLEATQERLVESAKLAGLGELAAGVAHEVNNPVGIVLTRVGYLLSVADEEGLDPDVIDDLAVIDHQARRIATVTRDLLQFGRPTSSERAPVSLQELLGLTVSLLSHQARQAGVSLELQEGPDTTHHVNRDQLEQVAFNLIKNALDACASGDGVEVRVRPDGFEVEDSGAGMDAEAQRRIFEPFFSTKGVGEGSGMGLSVSYGIVAEHQGSLTVRSSPGEGSTFTVTLPVQESA